MGTILVAGHVAGAAAASLHALLTKSDPRSAVSWIGICCLIPYGGPLLYWLFGINRVRTHRGDSPSAPFSWMPASMAIGVSRTLEAQARIGDALTGRPLERGNCVEPLH